MSAVFDAISTLLAPLGKPVHWISAPGAVTYPYLLVWPSTGAPGPDETLAGVITHVSGLYGVTSVAATVSAAATVAANVRPLLGETHPVDLPISGRQGLIRWESFGTASEDTDVTIPTLNTHPGIYVDLYRVEIA